MLRLAVAKPDASYRQQSRRGVSYIRLADGDASLAQQNV